MKTIRKIADEIGVSKQAVFKKMKREPLSTSLRGLTSTVDGRLTVSVDGEKLIKQAFSCEIPSTTDNQLTPTVDGLVDAPSTKNEDKLTVVDGVISALQDMIEVLKDQLAMKDRQLAAKDIQIQTLQEELSRERQHSREQSEKIAVLADQSQKLQLAQMQPQLEDSWDDKTDQEQQHWWQRFWK